MPPVENLKVCWFIVLGLCFSGILAGSQASDKEFVFKPVLTYETKSDLVGMGFVRAFSVDTKTGMAYGLDMDAKCILVWDKNGRFVKTIGRKGEGPGEFLFKNKVGDLIVWGNKIVIVDESTAKIHVFDAEQHLFSYTVSRPSPLKRIYLYLVKDQLAVLSHSSGKMEQEVFLLDENLQVKKKIISRPYNQFEWIDGVKFIFRPYANMVKLAGHKDYLIVGETQENLFHKYDPDGTMIGSFKLPMMERDIVQKDKDKHTQRFLSGGNLDRVRFEYPRHLPFFSDIFICDEYFVVIDAEEGEPNVSGVVYKENLKVGSFNQVFDGLNYIFPMYGVLYVLSVEGDGEYKITSYKLFSK